MPRSNHPLVAVKDLCVHFPVRTGLFRRPSAYVQAVHEVSLQIQPQETLGLVGETGCGKSTLARTILRLQKSARGEILYRGRNITRLSNRQMKPIRRHMQMVFQDPAESLNDRHRVGTLLSEPFVIHKTMSQRERGERVAELLQKVGLSPAIQNRYPFEFSGGQRQRISIARAIALNPEFIVCDEPVSALDVSIQSQIINLFLELQESIQLSYLFIAHDLAVVKAVSDRIAVMYLGSIVETGDAESLCRTPQHPYTRALFAAVPSTEPVRRRNRPTLEGEVPSPIDRPSGCPFNTRCPHVQKRCLEERPALRSVGGGNRLVSCHYDL